MIFRVGKNAIHFHRDSWIWLVVLSCLVGCSGHENDGPPAHPTRGTLTVNGEPAVGANVSLHPADGQDFDTRGTRPTGRVLEDGTFVLSTYETNDGAPAGKYVVTVFWPKNPNAIEPSPDRLKNRYVNPKTSKIDVSIDEGENILPPIELSFNEH